MQDLLWPSSNAPLKLICNQPCRAVTGEKDRRSARSSLTYHSHVIQVMNPMQFKYPSECDHHLQPGEMRELGCCDLVKYAVIPQIRTHDPSPKTLLVPSPTTVKEEYVSGGLTMSMGTPGRQSADLRSGFIHTITFQAPLTENCPQAAAH